MESYPMVLLPDGFRAERRARRVRASSKYESTVRGNRRKSSGDLSGVVSGEVVSFAGDVDA